jgi:hypothetical protein
MEYLTKWKPTLERLDMEFNWEKAGKNILKNMGGMTAVDVRDAIQRMEKVKNDRDQEQLRVMLDDLREAYTKRFVGRPFTEAAAELGVYSNKGRKKADQLILLAISNMAFEVDKENMIDIIKKELNREQADYVLSRYSNEISTKMDIMSVFEAYHEGHTQKSFENFKKRLDKVGTVQAGQQLMQDYVGNFITFRGLDYYTPELTRRDADPRLSESLFTYMIQIIPLSEGDTIRAMHILFKRNYSRPEKMEKINEVKQKMAEISKPVEWKERDEKGRITSKEVQVRGTRDALSCYEELTLELNQIKSEVVVV